MTKLKCSYMDIHEYISRYIIKRILYSYNPSLLMDKNRMVKESRIWRRIMPYSASLNHTENLLESVADLLREDR